MSDHRAISDRLFRLSIGMFFIGGFVSSTVSLIVPRLRIFMGLGYSNAATVQLAFHASYLLFALPITIIIVLVGYMRGNAIGLLLMAGGCVMLGLALMSGQFLLMILALLTVSCGTSFLQIASNNSATLVGDRVTAAKRLNLLQGFNSVGTVLGPLVGAQFILRSGSLTSSVPRLVIPFIFASLVLAGLAVAFAANRDLLSGIATARTNVSSSDWPRLWKDRRLFAGAWAIFGYVGAEVTIGTFLTNYLMLPEVFGLRAVDAARLVSLYWGGAMVGRLAGAALLSRISEQRLLSGAALGAVALVSIAAVLGGPAGGMALLGIGLCNSVMYPTIYVLALPRDPALATPAAMVLCMAVVGGAVITWLTGAIADFAGLGPAFGLSALCYVGILAFARFCD